MLYPLSYEGKVDPASVAMATETTAPDEGNL